MIKVVRAVVHEVIKNKENGLVDKEVSEALFVIDENVEKIVADLEDKYSKSSQTTAIFSEPDEQADKLMPIHFKNYSENCCDDEFLIFSNKSFQKILPLMASKSIKGGYLLYVEYIVEKWDRQNHYVSVFLIRNKNGVVFHKEQGTKVFKINPAILIDIDHLAMAARINMDSYRRDDRYISLINKHSKDSSFFLQWLCAAEILNGKAQTHEFNNLIAEIELPRANGVQLKRDEFKSAVLDHISENEGQIDLRKIGEKFYKNSEHLINFIEQKSIVIDHEFKGDSEVLRKLLNIRVIADNIRLSFPSAYIDDDRVSVEDNVVIIRSKELVDKILAQQALNRQ